MLKEHMNEIENTLVAISKIPANSGHSLHKGTPREAFIREFLDKHLPQNIAIGTGEIIDSNSQPNEQRNQFDLVLYRKNYAKLDFGGDINAFLIESVIATIEVKSTLTEKDLSQSIKASLNAKKLSRNTSQLISGYVPPSILNFVIAYDGPQNMSTVYKWIPKIYNELKITSEKLPLEDDKRTSTPSKSIDAVFILNKGFLYFDNSPLGFVNKERRAKHEHLKWVMSDTENGSLLLFFLLIQQANLNVISDTLDPMPYLKNFKVDKLQFGI